MLQPKKGKLISHSTHLFFVYDHGDMV